MTKDQEIKLWQSRLRDAIEQKEAAEAMLRELGALTDTTTPEVVQPEWNPASKPPRLRGLNVWVKLSDGREFKGWYGGIYWRIIYPDSPDRYNGERLRPGDTVIGWK